MHGCLLCYANCLKWNELLFKKEKMKYFDNWNSFSSLENIKLMNFGFLFIFVRLESNGFSVSVYFLND